MFTIVEFACLIIITILCANLYTAVRRHTNQIQALQVQQVTQNDEMVANGRLRKSAVGALFIYLVFLVCYLPHLCIKVVAIIFGHGTATKHLLVYTWTLVFFHSSLNPLIYSWKMRNIRHTIMGIFQTLLPCQNY